MSAAAMQTPERRLRALDRNSPVTSSSTSSSSSSAAAFSARTCPPRPQRRKCGAEPRKGPSRDSFSRLVLLLRDVVTPGADEPPRKRYAFGDAGGAPATLSADGARNGASPERPAPDAVHAVRLVTPLLAARSADGLGAQRPRGSLPPALALDSDDECIFGAAPPPPPLRRYPSLFRTSAPGASTPPRYPCATRRIFDDDPFAALTADGAHA
ncbi:hypothetical protein M885DRAFT_551677 [Pelagophyceae sp. CCMP2097]|nr:hypothetical protein M885DRAFT_551677 [Pelagophyceae sp. CCMP2097]|mmetsp:Transcript_11486/g.40439  ORF Transcript_11486/g.40439 Transcript_11486/m.40439 type:complete len:212 (+) Transcript_11486:96-731(+)